MKNNNTRFIPFLLAICLIAGIAIGMALAVVLQKTKSSVLSGFNA